MRDIKQSLSCRGRPRLSQALTPYGSASSWLCCPFPHLGTSCGLPWGSRLNPQGRPAFPVAQGEVKALGHLFLAGPPLLGDFP